MAVRASDSDAQYSNTMDLISGAVHSRFMWPEVFIPGHVVYFSLICRMSIFQSKLLNVIHFNCNAVY